MPTTPSTHRPTRARKSDAAKPPETPRSPLTPTTWIDAATEVLADHGIDRVRVDELARTLGVTRGSFYWHFRDREDLLRNVLAAWRQRATEQLTARLTETGRSAEDQLLDVISLPWRGKAALRAARIELAIRAWARRDAMAAAALEEADGRRIDYISGLFAALGFEQAPARWRAFLLYTYVVGQSVMSKKLTTQERDERNAFVERLVRGAGGSVTSAGTASF